MSIIKFANLPKGRVTKAIISGSEKYLAEYIGSFGISLLFTERNEKIDSAISDHADVNVNYIGDGEIIIDNSQEHLFKVLKESRFKVIKPHKAVSGSYPDDCGLNSTELGERLIAGKKSAEKSILEKFSENKIIYVNQGYSKCSTCVVNRNAIITDDESIHKACIKVGINVLLISKGDVKLAGHNYGFIGGASTLIEKNKMLFFGNIKNHRDFKKIKTFLANNECEYISLNDYPLTDIGGLIAIEEEI